jgi:uncharacterized protein
VSVNGNEFAPSINENGYLVLERSWRPADELVLTLHMKPAYIAPHPRIDAIRGCVAGNAAHWCTASSHTISPQGLIYST